MALEHEKKGGPYTDKERINRLLEVFRLHFELGYPAVRIAAELKVNRNTINKDIQYWYSELAKDWRESDFDSWLQKELNRLELQRCRIIKQIKANFPGVEQIRYERLLFDIDSKILHIIMKTKSQFEKKLGFAPKSQCDCRINKIQKYDLEHLEKLR